MAESQTVDTIKTIKAKSGNLFTFFATLGGVVVGVVASMAMMGPLLQSQVASATKDLGKTVAIAPASSVAPECVLPAGEAASNQARIATASVPMTVPAPQAGGKGGEAPVPGAGGNNNNKIWVHKFVSGVWATNTATIKNTGADSTNIVKTTNTNTTTVTNKNNVWLSNNNAQKAVSGDVNSYDNTTSGTATSGAAHNTSDADMNVTITN